MPWLIVRAFSTVRQYLFSNRLQPLYCRWEATLVSLVNCYCLTYSCQLDFVFRYAKVVACSVDTFLLDHIVMIVTHFSDLNAVSDEKNSMQRPCLMMLADLLFSEVVGSNYSTNYELMLQLKVCSPCGV